MLSISYELETIAARILEIETDAILEKLKERKEVRHDKVTK